MARSGTYVYCIVSSRTKPRVTSGLRGVPYSSPVRVLPVTPGIWAVLSSVPLDRYSDAALQRMLREVSHISRIAVGHERVVERFLSSQAVLPMKILTLFTSDDRAIAHFAGQLDAIEDLVRRVERHHEWAIRVMFLAPSERSSTQSTRSSTAESARRAGLNRAARGRTGTRALTGSEFLRQKKAAADDARGRLSRARTVASELLTMMAGYASEVRQTPAAELAGGRFPTLLEAALLVPQASGARLKTAVARQSRLLSPDGYRITLSGPWPPYSFMRG